MTRKYWLLAVYAAALALSWPRTATPRPFDHFAIGYIGGSLISKGVEKVSPQDKWARFFIPVAAMGFVGWTIEYAQFQSNRGVSSDLVDDIGMTMVGASAGSLIEIEFDCLLCL